MSSSSFENQSEADYYMEQPQNERPPCKWCECEEPDHSCRECHMDNTEIACINNQGLCNDCRYKVDGRAHV